MLAPLLLLALTPAWAFSPADTLRRGHSHNDYRQKRPLADALAQGFSSVEADIWLRRGEIWISHIGLPFTWKGTLRQLYLDPLQKLVNERGSVYGDGKMGFILWIDIKDENPELMTELRSQLNRYPMLSVFGDTGEKIGAVTVILTGKERSKRSFVDEFRERPAIRDSNDYSPSDPVADDKWQWYAIKWSKVTSWDGFAPLDSREHERLAAVVAGAHAKHRKVRLWDMPSTDEVWKLCLDLGVDQLSVDDLPRFREYTQHYGSDK